MLDWSSLWEPQCRSAGCMQNLIAAPERCFAPSQITENNVPAAARATITLLVASAHQGNVLLAAARATIAIFHEKLVEDMSRWHQ